MTWWEKALLAYLALSPVSIAWLFVAAHNAPERNDW